MVPGFWIYETSGVLRPAVESYLEGRPMTGEHIAAMRAYLRQWIQVPGFAGPDVDHLRRTLDCVGDRPALAAWLRRAEDAGIDPL